MAVEGTRSRRRSIRLRGYDYGQEGPYFVTICTSRRTCLLGDVTDGKMTLTAVGTIVRRVWRDLPRRLGGVCLDAFIAMPNHIHGLVFIRRSVGAGLAPPKDGGPPGQTGAASRAPTLPDVMRAFKSISTVRVNRALGRTGMSLWQRGYYEHVVRDEEELNRLRRYITENPLKWDEDADNPAARRTSRRPLLGSTILQAIAFVPLMTWTARLATGAGATSDPEAASWIAGEAAILLERRDFVGVTLFHLEIPAPP